MQNHKAASDFAGHHSGGRLLLLQGDLLQGIHEGSRHRDGNGLPHGEYAGTVGAISRKNMYKVACEELCEDGSCEAENRKKNVANGCVVELSDRTTYCLSAEKLDAVFQAGLKACGYIEDQEIKKIAWNSDMCCAR